jgi:hypothetical protein
MLQYCCKISGFNPEILGICLAYEINTILKYTAQQVNAIYRFVCTSQETHYVSATSPTG